MQGFDFDVHPALLGLPLQEGDDFHAHAHGAGDDGLIVFAPLLAMMRLSSIKRWPCFGRLRQLMRSIPLVLVIFWFFFLVPYIRRVVIGPKEPIKVGAFWSAAITFTMFEAAYYCEIMRAGIQSIPAARCGRATRSGSTTGQTMARSSCAGVRTSAVLLTQTIILFPGHLARV